MSRCWHLQSSTIPHTSIIQSYKTREHCIPFKAFPPGTFGGSVWKLLCSVVEQFRLRYGPRESFDDDTGSSWTVPHMVVRATSVVCRWKTHERWQDVEAHVASAEPDSEGDGVDSGSTCWTSGLLWREETRGEEE